MEEQKVVSQRDVIEQLLIDQLRAAKHLKNSQQPKFKDLKRVVKSPTSAKDVTNRDDIPNWQTTRQHIALFLGMY